MEARAADRQAVHSAVRLRAVEVEHRRERLGVLFRGVKAAVGCAVLVLVAVDGHAVQPLKTIPASCGIGTSRAMDMCMVSSFEAVQLSRGICEDGLGTGTKNDH